MRLFRYFILAFTLVFSFCSMAENKIIVLAASSLTTALDEIKIAYKKSHPTDNISISYASSSILAKQIENGAPADIFISANQQWMDYLINKKDVTSSSVLLKNSLVLIAPVDSPISAVVIDNKTNWAALLPKNEKMAVGNTSHVPAGIYAKEALTYFNVFDKLKPKMINAANVRDALMYVDRGEVALGVVYKTDAIIDSNVKIIGEFPQKSYTPVEYPITLINKNGTSFYQFLKSKAASDIFEKYGFVLP